MRLPFFCLSVSGRVAPSAGQWGHSPVRERRPSSLRTSLAMDKPMLTQSLARDHRDGFSDELAHASLRPTSPVNWPAGHRELGIVPLVPCTARHARSGSPYIYVAIPRSRRLATVTPAGPAGPGPATVTAALHELRPRMGEACGLRGLRSANVGQWLTGPAAATPDATQ